MAFTKNFIRERLINVRLITPPVLEQLKGINLRQIYRMIDATNDGLVTPFEQWLQHLGLIPLAVTCICGQQMKLFKHKNGKRWECTKRNCRKKRGFYKGTFFEGSHLTPEEIFLFSYFWNYDMDKCENLYREFKRDIS
ncbi:hypothetical protein DdX_21936 [Ditylenchus destructor]|uniref:Uncharacterized protein n=1 Tax=Ditylenchus destructor TaxID=166010 RepID=A0AAD4MFL1_9BILA|nr:hypothetical protein DdX_21936 [Ditylenchus destructor]